jgi:hypothetical protein
MNDDPEWLRKKTEQEDGCDVSVGGIPTVRCAWCGGELLNRNAAQAPLDRTRPEGAYVTQILPDELSAAAGQRPRYKLEHVVGDCTVSSITVTEDEARSVQHAIAALIAKENAG